MWVRGVFFIQVLEYVKQDRGRTSYELLGRGIDGYRPEKKYGFNDFVELLSRVKLVSSGEEDYRKSQNIYQRTDSQSHIG